MLCHRGPWESRLGTHALPPWAVAKQARHACSATVGRGRAEAADQPPWGVIAAHTWRTGRPGAPAPLEDRAPADQDAAGLDDGGDVSLGELGETVVAVVGLAGGVTDSVTPGDVFVGVGLGFGVLLTVPEGLGVGVGVSETRGVGDCTSAGGGGRNST